VHNSATVIDGNKIDNVVTQSNILTETKIFSYFQNTTNSLVIDLTRNIIQTRLRQ